MADWRWLAQKGSHLRVTGRVSHSRQPLVYDHATKQMLRAKSRFNVMRFRSRLSEHCRSASLRLDARELDHLGPFVDIFGDELGELGRRARQNRYGAEISEPLLDVRVENRRVGLLVERRDDLRRRAPGDTETDPASRLVALEEAVDRRHVRQEWKRLYRRHAQRPELSGLDQRQ